MTPGARLRISEWWVDPTRLIESAPRLPMLSGDRSAGTGWRVAVTTISSRPGTDAPAADAAQANATKPGSNDAPRSRSRSGVPRD